MFTGLVQAIGSVGIAARSTLTIEVPQGLLEGDPLLLGESIAINGCCLTVARFSGQEASFDLSDETLQRTNLGGLQVHSKVNVERAMKPTDRFGGHIVQGHVDALGELVSRRANETGTVLRFRVPPDGDVYLIDKGSIAIDGVSLTVVQPQDGEFDVWVIPHTLTQTTLGAMQPGNRVNLEYDVVAKYVQRLARG